MYSFKSARDIMHLLIKHSNVLLRNMQPWSESFISTIWLISSDFISCTFVLYCIFWCQMNMLTSSSLFFCLFVLSLFLSSSVNSSQWCFHHLVCGQNARSHSMQYYFDCAISKKNMSNSFYG